MELKELSIKLESNFITSLLYLPHFNSLAVILCESKEGALENNNRMMIWDLMQNKWINPLQENQILAVSLVYVSEFGSSQTNDRYPVLVSGNRDRTVTIWRNFSNLKDSKILKNVGIPNMELTLFTHMNSTIIL